MNARNEPMNPKSRHANTLPPRSGAAVRGAQRSGGKSLRRLAFDVARFTELAGVVISRNCSCIEPMNLPDRALTILSQRRNNFSLSHRMGGQG